MPIWKQIFAALIVAVAAFAGWAVVAPQTLPPALMELAGRVGLPVGSEEAAPGTAGRSGPGSGGRGGGGGPERVVTAAVGEITSTRRVQAVGTAEAKRSVTMFAPTAGLVTEVLFETGIFVEKDAALLRLDDREQQIDVEKAQIRVQQMRDQFDRAERLARTQAVSAVQVEEARANLASAQAELAGAELELERRTLRAPFSGHMGLAQVSEGDRVTSTTPVANIDDREVILVRYSVPERYAGRTVPGTRVSATTVSFGSRVFEGTIAEVDSRIDPQTRTLTARAAIDNTSDMLRPGMAFLVETTFEGESHASVPLLSLQWDRDGSFVWQVVDGRVKRTNIEIIERGAEAALVSGPLRPADRIVLEGVQRLREGSEVSVAERDEEAQGRS